MHVARSRGVGLTAGIVFLLAGCASPGPEPDTTLATAAPGDPVQPGSVPPETFEQGILDESFRLDHADLSVELPLQVPPDATRIIGTVTVQDGAYWGFYVRGLAGCEVADYQPTAASAPRVHEVDCEAPYPGLQTLTVAIDAAWAQGRVELKAVTVVGGVAEAPVGPPVPTFEQAVLNESFRLDHTMPSVDLRLDVPPNATRIFGTVTILEGVFSEFRVKGIPGCELRDPRITGVFLSPKTYDLDCEAPAGESTLTVSIDVLWVETSVELKALVASAPAAS